MRRRKRDSVVGRKRRFLPDVRRFFAILVVEPSIMALFKTRSAAVYGIDAHLIDVEVDMYKSGTARYFITVGMPDSRNLKQIGKSVLSVLASLISTGKK